MQVQFVHFNRNKIIFCDFLLNIYKLSVHVGGVLKEET